MLIVFLLTLSSFFEWAKATNEFEIYFNQQSEALNQSYKLVEVNRGVLQRSSDRYFQLQAELHRIEEQLKRLGIRLSELPTPALPSQPIASDFFLEDQPSLPNSREEVGNQNPDTLETRIILRNQVLKELHRMRQIILCVQPAFSMLEKDYIDKMIAPKAKRYAWAIPNDEAIQELTSHGPLIELGAGGGYWAFLLDQKGVDIVAYDDFSWMEDPAEPHPIWFSKLEQGDEGKLQDLENKHRTLFLCWPPKTLFAANALDSYQGDTFLYVGELSKGGVLSMADSVFFRYLETHFNLIKTVKIPNWPGFTDQLYVYKRKLTQKVPSILFDEESEYPLERQLSIPRLVQMVWNWLFGI